jgi:hypothetical protein
VRAVPAPGMRRHILPSYTRPSSLIRVKLHERRTADPARVRTVVASPNVTLMGASALGFPCGTCAVLPLRPATLLAVDQT